MSTLFTKLERAAWGGFIATQSRLFQHIEDDLRRRFRITHAEFEVLLRLFLSNDGRARIQDLAARSLLSRSGTSRAVERLARAGHVVRHDAEEDGRGAYAVLTPSGRERFLEAAEAHVTLVRREYLSHFSQSELEQMVSFWERLSPGPASEADEGAAATLAGTAPSRTAKTAKTATVQRSRGATRRAKTAPARR
ncbi:MAG: MarR family winged helix-turn-helix transcriptional regulator [Sandaracinaceae bacterium]|nr:MarR family winged helix-turn-helix transcriptional regulator [Sandaracinaceae bacterium]